MSEESKRFPEKAPRGRDLFSSSEDIKLLKLVEKFGEDWIQVSKEMPKRNERQCRERYKTYLSPNVIIGNWTDEEDALILKLVGDFGRKWVQISKRLPNRSDTAIKNRYSVLKKKIGEQNQSENSKRATSIQNDEYIRSQLDKVFGFVNYNHKFDLFADHSDLNQFYSIEKGSELSY